MPFGTDFGMKHGTHARITRLRRMLRRMLIEMALCKAAEKQEEIVSKQFKG